MPVPKGVGLTSLITAAARHAELSASEPLIRDPYAGTLAGEVGEDAYQKAIKADPTLSVLVTLRDRWFDDYIMECVNKHNIEQLVILGSGMDTRAWRMNLPKNVTIFEVDFPDVHKYKNRILEKMGAVATCKRKCIDLDLQDANSFEKIPIDKSKPVLWIAEGLVYYLNEDSFNDLLQFIKENSPPGSRLIIDLASQDVLKTESISLKFEALEKDFRAQLLFFAAGDPKKLLEKCGFTKNIKSVSVREMIEKMNVQDRFTKCMLEEGTQYCFIVTGEK